MRTDKAQISKVRNAKGEITTNMIEIQETNREYIEIIYTINLKILKKWTDL
jgi:hypothetical protein